MTDLNEDQPDDVESKWTDQNFVWDRAAAKSDDGDDERDDSADI